ncbi:pyridoxal phosphate-dependent aminotransferase [Luteolibacter marinus]|uniref:pyridoxal phosphate-dependent aminotransferase n=1 Tax=Luteolibacter marinus TaxID=2776705 RepID=UPI0018670454|nr:aminotransferase class I/II-fold pyridoxal phosphate-dependent enzyme [Luteolibacter marinus]
MSRLAERTSRIDASGIRKVFDLAKKLKDPINLSIGQPDFDVPEEVKKAAHEAIDAGKNTYTPTQGIAELREQLIAEEKEFTGREWGADELLVTSGVSGGLFLALLALVEDGDEVIIPDPYFVMYKHLVRLFGGTPVYLDTYDSGFGIDPAKLEALITPRTKVLLLNSPANPTGRILSRGELEGVAAVCRKHGLLVISDEIYRKFAYVEMVSMAEVYEDTLMLGGHSKAFGMTGWRLGYACGPADVIQAMTKVQQYSFVCAPAVTQFAALACPQVVLEPYIDAYRAKRDLMVGILSECFELGPPDGAFYLWAKAPDGFTGSSFVEKAIANNLLIIPGNVFSEKDTHFRICYTVPDDKLKEGAELLCRIARGEV